MKSIVHSIAAAALLASAVLIARDAAAGDVKILPGVACQHSSGGTPVWQPGTGRFYNSSPTGSLKATCPIVREDSTGDLVEATVWVRDLHYDADAWCKIHAQNPQGDVGYVSATKYTSGSNGTAQALSFGALDSYTDGAYFVECWLPAVYDGGGISLIASIRTEEP